MGSPSAAGEGRDIRLQGRAGGVAVRPALIVAPPVVGEPPARLADHAPHFVGRRATDSLASVHGRRRIAAAAHRILVQSDRPSGHLLGRLFDHGGGDLVGLQAPVHGDPDDPANHVVRLAEREIRLAHQIVREVGQDRARQVERAFQLALQRRPSAEEKVKGLDFLGFKTGSKNNMDLQKITFNRATYDKEVLQITTASRLLSDFCLAMFNLNEFIFLQ